MLGKLSVLCAAQESIRLLVPWYIFTEIRSSQKESIASLSGRNCPILTFQPRSSFKAFKCPCGWLTISKPTTPFPQTQCVKSYLLDWFCSLASNRSLGPDILTNRLNLILYICSNQTKRVSQILNFRFQTFATLDFR